MRLKPLQRRTEDEQFMRYIRTEYYKEMAMAHSSYARAAGIQSEISKVTVTRVASSEVECKRQTNVYKKDMILTLNNISREQRILRKAMVGYSKKKKQHKLIKEKREKELLERERQKREHIEEWEQIHKLLNIQNGVSENNTEEDQTDGDCDNKSSKASSDSPMNDENNNETTTDIAKKLQSDGISQSLNPFEVLPAITEAEDEQETPKENEQETAEETVQEKSVIEDKSSTTETKQISEELQSTISPLFSLTLRPLKPRKQVVSFSDIIKLKHSHNTNKLFDMVHVLAEKHGVNESVEKRRAERRKSRIPKGSTDAVISESLRKAASVIYPMKFGYGDHESNNKEKFDFSSEANEQLVSEPIATEAFDQKQNENTSGDTSHRMRRYKSTPGFNEELKKLRKQELFKANTEEDRRLAHMSTRSSMSRFPPISSTKSTPNHSRSNSVSWTEAFGLLKIVHNIE